MRIALAQIDPVVGAFEANVKKIKEAYERACAEQARLLLTPEMGICGYPPNDLVERPRCFERSEAALDELAQAHRREEVRARRRSRRAQSASRSGAPLKRGDDPRGREARFSPGQDACCRLTMFSTRPATSSPPKSASPGSATGTKSRSRSARTSGRKTRALAADSIARDPIGGLRRGERGALDFALGKPVFHQKMREPRKTSLRNREKSRRPADLRQSSRRDRRNSFRRRIFCGRWQRGVRGTPAVFREIVSASWRSI